MADGDDTQEAPAGEPPPTTELDPAATASAGPLAYSEFTSGLPVVEYQPTPRRRIWWKVAALVAAILSVTGGAAAAILLLGQGPLTRDTTTTSPVTSTSAVSPPASTIEVPAVTDAQPQAPATVTVTAEPITPVVTPEAPLPPDAQFTQMLARDGISNTHPSGSIATAKNVCLSIASGSTADDFALSMNASGMPYREAVVFVRDAIAVYCPNAG